MIIAAAGPVAPPLEVEKAEQHELVLQRGVEAPAALLARHLRAEADRQLLQQQRRHGRCAAATRRRHRYYHWRFCGGNILLSVSGGSLEYPK